MKIAVSQASTRFNMQKANFKIMKEQALSQPYTQSILDRFDVSDINEEEEKGLLSLQTSFSSLLDPSVDTIGMLYVVCKEPAYLL